MKKIKLMPALVGVAGLTGIMVPAITSCGPTTPTAKTITRAEFIETLDTWFATCQANRKQYKISDLTLKVNGESKKITQIKYEHDYSEAKSAEQLSMVMIWIDGDYFPILSKSGTDFAADLPETGAIYQATDDYVYFKNENAEGGQIAELKINKYGYYETFSRKNAISYTVSYNGAPTIDSKVLKFKNKETGSTSEGTFTLGHGIRLCISKTDTPAIECTAWASEGKTESKTATINLIDGKTDETIDTWTYTLPASVTSEFAVKLVLSDGVYDKLNDLGDYHFTITDPA